MEAGDGEIQQRSFEKRQVDDATQKERHAEERLGTKSDEPEAGDRDRSERSPQERREGTAPQVQRRQEKTNDQKKMTALHTPRA